MLEMSAAAIRVGNSGNTHPAANYCTEQGETSSANSCGVVTAKKKSSLVEEFDTKILDKCLLQEQKNNISLNGNHFGSGREKHFTKKKVSNVSDKLASSCSVNACTSNCSATCFSKDDSVKLSTAENIKTWYI